MKEIKFIFEEETDYNDFIKNLLETMEPKVGEAIVDDTTITVIIKNLNA
jgi:hypothetical protein